MLIHLGNDGWLAGFIDPDGSFQVRTSLNSSPRKIANLFELSQPSNNNYGTYNLAVMLCIANFLGVTVNSIRNDRPNPQYGIRVSSASSIELLVTYLSSFKSLKHQDYS
jgi:hypothetical protein